MIYLSVCLRCNSCTFCWFFHRSFLFSSGFGDLCSHAFWCNKGTPTDQMNEQRPQSFLTPPKKKIKSNAGTSFFQGNKKKIKPKTEMTAKRRERSCTVEEEENVAKMQKETRILSIFFFFFPRARVCKWRNWPRRK